MDKSPVWDELKQIIVDSFGDDLRAVPDDVPILDLGISSLALVEGMRRVYDRFGVLVSIRRVIEGQVTLGGLALYIEQELNTRQAVKKRAQISSEQWKIQREVLLAPSQQHIGFLSRYSEEASTAFNESLLIRLKGALDGTALQAAIEEVGDRYEALRTALNADSNALDIGAGEPLELVMSQASAVELEQRLTEIVARPFEMGRRLFRAELLRLSETEHVLALVGHSLLLDHPALLAILEDIARLYGAFSQNQAASPAAPALQWSDYLAMGETAEAKEAHRTAEAYWTEQLASAAPRLELPTDHPRPAVKRYSGARLSMQIESSLQERLQAWATAEGVGLEALLFAAYAAFLHRLSDQKDMVVGFESEPLYPSVGLQVIAPTRNILPIKTSFDSAMSFKDHARIIADSLAQAQAHRTLSLGELISLLDLERDQSRSPLFIAALRAWTEEPAPVFEALDSAYAFPPSPGARYDLELIPASVGADAWLVCDYSTELFEAETISRWLKGMLALLDSALKDDTQACGLLPMLEAHEREQVLFEWNRTEKPYPRERTVLDLIMEQTQSRPEHVAVRFGETSLSYEQLAGRVEAISAALRSSGVKHGDRVGILMKRSLDLIPSILAIWRVGALYVPMDIGFPKSRLAYMLTDAEVRAVIINRELLGLLDEHHSSTAICIGDVDTLAPAIKSMSAKGSDGAYVIYTSGSTGRPKGVEIRHSALLNCLLATKEYLEFTPQSSMLALTTVSFDISTNELLMPLIAGGCVDLGEDGLVADGIQLAERIGARKPSHVQTTPSTWKAALTAGWSGAENVCLVSSGEALTRDLAEQLLGKCRALWNLYGPTETTVFSAAYQVESAPGKPMRIGRPLPNTQMYILDQQYQPVPIGAVGELFIGGEGVAVGYWHRPELTDERFFPNPFRAGERMYRTGDLARYLTNGDINCVGRLDDQVKIHGVRVELGEVESALRDLEGVRDAVVVSWKDARGDTQLVAHVIADKQGLAASKIREGLRGQLPEVMIPPHILFSEAFPLTANGKVHRASLPSPNEANAMPAEPITEAPATSTERALARAWANVLGIDAGLIGRDSDFMDLGGHSLLMTLLMLEVRKLFQVSFSLREFFSASTLRKFAALIDERQQRETENANDRVRSASIRNAEWARQRMAFLQREAQLPLYIAPARGLSYEPHNEKKKVFLTGATGFLGAYIIAEILKRTDSDLYCLVRSKRGENSKQRVEKQMRNYEVWSEGEAWQSASNRRLHIVEGDITLPRLGMQDSVYESLAREVDMIFHGAAHVNFIYPYEALRATNVLGIHELIQFAFHLRIKPIHHLSTAAIWPMGAQYTYYEKDSIDHTGLLNLGYDEAKWVGERCLLYAAERGLPLARYRPGEVGGDSVTGHCVTDHFLIACLKGFLQFGALPQLDIEVDVAPVDYVAKVMVQLAFHGNSLGRAFHLTNPYRRRLSDGITYLRGLGYQFEELPFEELRDRLVNSRDFAANALFAYQAALEDMDNISMQLPTYDTRETQRELEGSGIACPPADEKLFGTYLGYLQQIGFLPQPNMLTTQIQSNANYAYKANGIAIKSS